ncbi:hypothetical protein [Vreelandella titanicae]|uniref:hypothetical protein n=1 Tax=Vreelandella titanicae TaxID=664683 RepID=UPI003FD7684C
METGISAWFVPTLTAALGGTIGGIIVGIAIHLLSTGRDRRKERNEARRPIWVWFKDTPPGDGTELSEFEAHHKNDLNKYEYQAPKSEWRKFKKHYDAINLLRKKVRSSSLDIETFTQIHAVELTQAELDKVSNHWRAILRLTRHRK